MTEHHTDPRRGRTQVEWLPAWSRAEGTARVTSAFHSAFGGKPDGVWSAPGRVNLIGEHTDYNAGLCLPIALPHRTYVALRSRNDDVIRLLSAQEPDAGVWIANLAEVAPGIVTGWGTYAAGVAWALQQSGYSVTGFDAVIDSCVPYGAGLSSSAALECAVAVALAELDSGSEPDEATRAELVGPCIRAENEIAGAPTGGMDQSASLRCRAGHALLLDFRDGSANHIPLALSEQNLALLVIDTRAVHQLVDGRYAARRDTCTLAAQRLGVQSLRDVINLDTALATLGHAPGEGVDVTSRRVRHVLSENARVELVTHLLADNGAEKIGPVLTSAHASLRDDYEVSCPELDLAVDTANAAGALGARMVGGGFGGSAIALVTTPNAAPVAEAVTAAFADAEMESPAFLIATAEGPAGRC